MQIKNNLRSQCDPHQYPGITKVLAELDTENFRLKKLVPKSQDVVLPFVATSSVRFIESGNYTAYMAASGDGARTVSMQTSRVPEPGVYRTRPGVWYGNEHRRDALGVDWMCSMGDHVQDDFGVLVPVPAPAASLKWVQS
jgi:hypothetical protein